MWEAQQGSKKDFALNVMYSARFANGLNTGKTKAAICKELEPLKGERRRTIWNGVPKPAHMILSTLMLLGLRIEGRGGNVVDLSAVMARCGDAFDTVDVEGSEEAVQLFLSECIRVGIQL